MSELVTVDAIAKFKFSPNIEKSHLENGAQLESTHYIIACSVEKIFVFYNFASHNFENFGGFSNTILNLNFCI